MEEIGSGLTVNSGVHTIRMILPHTVMVNCSAFLILLDARVTSELKALHAKQVLMFLEFYISYLSFIFPTGFDLWLFKILTDYSTFKGSALVTSTPENIIQNLADRI